MIRNAVSAPGGSCKTDRIQSLARAVVSFSCDHSRLVAVFREGQYRFFEYERRLMAIYQQSLSFALGREIGLAEYLFALGGLRFCAIRSALHGVVIRFEDLTPDPLQGPFPRNDLRRHQGFRGTATPHPVALEANARERLLRSGKRLFGEKGFFETNIHEITDLRRAVRRRLLQPLRVQGGVLRGAHPHARPRRALLHRAEYRRRAMARPSTGWSASCGACGCGSCTSPRQGLLSRSCARRSSSLPAAVRDYYGHFVDGYRKNPEGNGDADQGTAIEFLLGIAHYSGHRSRLRHDSVERARGDGSHRGLPFAGILRLAGLKGGAYGHGANRRDRASMRRVSPSTTRSSRG